MTEELTRTAMDVLDAYTEDMPSVNLEPGRLNWYHGVDAGKVKTPGVFFGRDTAFTDVPPPPWEPDERFMDDDGLGYSTPQLRVAILGWREQWFIPGETKKDKIQWLPSGSRAPEGTKIKKQLEYLVLVDGLADPMVLSVSGFHKSRPMEDIVRGFERGGLAQLMRQKKRALPRWVCWLPIGGKTDANGKPIYEKASTASGEEQASTVTPPALLGVPEIVSAETMQLGIDTWNLYNSLGWFKYQRTNRDTVEAVYTVDAPRQLNARNVPQPIEEGFEEAPPF